MENVGVSANQGAANIAPASGEAAPEVRNSGNLASASGVAAALGGLETAQAAQQVALLRGLIADARDPAKPPVSAEVARELLAQATYAFSGVPVETTRAAAANLTNVDNLLMGAERMTSALAERDAPRPPSGQVPATPFAPGAGMRAPLGRPGGRS